MRHEASGALLTLGWVVLAAYLAAVLIVALAVGAARMAAAAAPRGRWSPAAAGLCGVAAVFSALVWRNDAVLYLAAAGLILSAAWELLRRGQEVDHA